MSVLEDERAAIVAALRDVYRFTEHGQMPSRDYCLGHDIAVLQVADRLGISRDEVED